MCVTYIIAERGNRAACTEATLLSSNLHCVRAREVSNMDRILEASDFIATQQAAFADLAQQYGNLDELLAKK